MIALALALPGRLPSAADIRTELTSWLYLGEGAAARVELERSFAGRLERLDSGDTLQRHADALRRPYIDAIGALSLLNDSPAWWASELAAKSPYTRLFERVCALAVARELLDDGLDDCLVVCATPALLAEIDVAATARGIGTRRVPLPPPVANTSRRAMAARRLVERYGPRLPLPFANALARLEPWTRPVLERTRPFRRRVLASLGATSEPFSGAGTALLVTWVDDRSVTPAGTYVDPHLGWLPGALRDRGYRVAVLPRFLRPAGFSDFARRLLATGEQFVFPELLVDAAALRRCRETAQSFTPDIPDGAAVAGVPLARLAREHVEEYRKAQEGNLVYRPLVEALARAGIAPELIVHTFEGHAWEQTLASAVRAHLPDTRLVGFDNLNLTRFALARFPAAVELGRRPLPDRIVTTGEIARAALVAEGMPDRIVTAGCAIRHAHVARSEAGLHAGDAAERPIVLVATDASFDRAVELVSKAAEAFGSDDSCQLVVKCHPLLAPGRVETFLREVTGLDGVYADTPFPELLSSAAMLLYTYSSVCYEALAAGVPPVFVQAETDLDVDQLEPFPELRWTGRTAAELRAAAERIMSLQPTERAEWRRRAGEAVRATLAPVGPDCLEAFLS